jgi:microcystin-dependent protein
MNTLNLTNSGQVAFTQDVLKFMQEAYTAVISALGTAVGDNVTLSGCNPDNNGNISTGIVAINGEVLPFAGGLLLANFDVAQVTTNRQYYDGSQKPFYNTRTAVMSATGGVPYAQFVRLKSLKQFANLPTQAGSDYSQPDDNTLATITALFNLSKSVSGAAFPSGLIVMWSGAVSAIPVGWALCNGANGTPDLRDRFIVGAGNTYAVGTTGGEATHVLSTNEMPAHTHTFDGSGDNKVDSNANQTNAGRGVWQNNNDVPGTYTGHMNSTGSGQAHENRPPYFALCYIMKL